MRAHAAALPPREPGAPARTAASTAAAPIAAIAAAVALSLGCATARAAGAPSQVEVGTAAYYGDRFEGRRTASGEAYDGTKLTCAHRTHPFGAVLEVTDLATGQAVEVTVNDRGPFGKGRLVDLSREAARRLGMLGRGTARVRVVRIR